MSSKSGYSQHEKMLRILRKGYLVPMLAMELLTKEWKGKDTLNE